MCDLKLDLVEHMGIKIGWAALVKPEFIFLEVLQSCVEISKTTIF